jgi:hypothetical protein
MTLRDLYSLWLFYTFKVMLCIVSNDQRQFLVTRDRYPWMDAVWPIARP